MIYKFFDNKLSGSGVKSNVLSNQRSLDFTVPQLAEDLHKPIIRKFENIKIHSSFKSNIWGANLADMQIIS